MWNEQKAILTTELSSGETLLWSGQPRQGLIFRLADIYFLFVIGFGVFLAYFIYTSTTFSAVIRPVCHSEYPLGCIRAYRSLFC